MMNEDATRPNGKTGPLSSEELRTLTAYWSAANCLFVGANLPARQPVAQAGAEA
jgi:hypothetical protein